MSHYSLPFAVRTSSYLAVKLLEKRKKYHNNYSQSMVCPLRRFYTRIETRKNLRKIYILETRMIHIQRIGIPIQENCKFHFEDQPQFFQIRCTHTSDGHARRPDSFNASDLLLHRFHYLITSDLTKPSKLKTNQYL